jgi:hypothetical protein
MREKATSEFLDLVIFKEFCDLEDFDRWLTFNKSYRLVNVDLTPDGVITNDFIWKLDCVIDT